MENEHEKNPQLDVLQSKANAKIKLFSNSPSSIQHFCVVRLHYSIHI